MKKILVSALNISLFSMLSFSSVALAKIETVCSGEKLQGRSFDYCVRTNPDSKAIIYFFHGILGSSSSYKKVITAYLDPIWQKKGIPLPNVVAVSFGASWIMSEAKGGKELYKYFAQSVQPFLEQRFKFDSSFHRSVMGMSMGGFNAVQAFAKQPEMYERAAFLCPALHTINPYSSQGEIDAFIKRTGASRQLVSVAQDIGQSEYTSLEEWNLEGPFAVAARMTPNTTPIYVGIGDSDQFGFQEGSIAFAEFMKTKTTHVELYVIKGGGHCSWATEELARFMEPTLQ